MRGMGRTYKRGAIWWIRYWHRGKEYRESSKSDVESVARRLLKKRIGEIATGRLIGPKEEKVTFDDLARGIKQDYAINAKRSKRSIELSISHLELAFAMLRAVDITTDRIQKYILDRQSEGAKNASINRELSCLKRMFPLASRAGLLGTKPYIPMLEENNARQGFMDYAEFLALRAALPDYLRDPITFLYRSGWRLGEMQSLEWRDVDLANHSIHLKPENSKSKDGRNLSLDGELLEIIKHAHDARRLDCVYVFHRDGRPIGDFRKSWSKACTAAGMSNKLRHDMRRSAIRNMVRAGVPERVAMSISGHKTRAIFDRYNIVNEEDQAAAQDSVERYLKSQPQESNVITLPIPSKITA
jgi:integrase